ncbi:hydrolase [Thiocapsa marina]|uniref:Alpha/beta hydrolase fold protein n=1 Tax=Thiocapsa marina 5811 TaxID=768671 RepID=F9UFL4_9GAMM|nr:hydrolase [Thiocapsa marina]EGV16888.1 alpha/beta hydrolase fold protein [Thiocapsa marina 5811]
MGAITRSTFRPAWWLPGAHLQTLWPSLSRPRPRPDLARRRIELADGDFIDLAIGRGAGPRILVIHGLEGGLDSHYAASLVARLEREGFQPIFMFLRGCSDESNRLDRAYHSGATEDLAEVLAVLAGDPRGVPAAAIGFSLGANLLLKYLGETDRPAVGSAIAVSVPFVLRDAMLRLDMGFSRVYRRHLLTKLKASLRRKFHGRRFPLQVDLDAIRDFNAFDDRITAPLNGFEGVFDYYSRASCRQFLPSIRTPTLIIHAIDDPFMFPTTIPWEHELGPEITLELSDHGGHVGFIAGPWPWRAQYWLEDRIVAGLSDFVKR